MLPVFAVGGTEDRGDRDQESMGALGISLLLLSLSLGTAPLNKSLEKVHHNIFSIELRYAGIQAFLLAV